MISVQFSVSRDDSELVGDIFECDSIEDAIDALRAAANELEAEEAPNQRQRGDDDGAEYGDPRDYRDGRE